MSDKSAKRIADSIKAAAYIVTGTNLWMHGHPWLAAYLFACAW